MSWWVYENWTAKRGGKAIVHKGICTFCREGRGVQRKIRAETVSGTDHLILEKWHISTQDSLTEQERTFAASAKTQSRTMRKP
jgi:RPA family protein